MVPGKIYRVGLARRIESNFKKLGGYMFTIEPLGSLCERMRT
jgi:hypothetical protein